jgi:Acetyltransferase (GNAT) domain
LSEQTLLLTPDDPAWDNWLERTAHDVYHRAGFHRLSEAAGEGRALMVVHSRADRFMLWPYLIRPTEAGDLDASSVYGYPGPLGQGLEDESFAQRAWQAVRSVWTEQGLVAVFTRFHPLLMNDRICEGLHGAAPVEGGEILTLGRSVSIDATKDLDGRRSEYPSVLRQQIRGAERAGLKVDDDPDCRFLPEFGDFYRQTMLRNGATESYFYSDQYMDELRTSLPGQAFLAVAHVEGKPAGIMFYTVAGKIAQAHLTGTNPEFQRLSPNKVLFDRVPDLVAARGAERLHLGAGRGGFEDSLFHFKSRFSNLRSDFRVGRWILRADRYGDLVRQRFGEAAPDDKYFPAYRAPVRVSDE